MSSARNLFYSIMENPLT